MQPMIANSAGVSVVYHSGYGHTKVLAEAVARGWKDKLAAGFTNSASQSGDKLNSLVQLAIFAMQHGMVWVGLDLLPGNNSSKGSIADLNRLGGFVGAMAQSNSDAPPSEAPIESDRKTAEHLGRRVATMARRLAPLPQAA